MYENATVISRAAFLRALPVGRLVQLECWRADIRLPVAPDKSVRTVLAHKSADIVFKTQSGSESHAPLIAHDKYVCIPNVGWGIIRSHEQSPSIVYRPVGYPNCAGRRNQLPDKCCAICGCNTHADEPVTV